MSLLGNEPSAGSVSDSGSAIAGGSPDVLESAEEQAQAQVRSVGSVYPAFIPQTGNISGGPQTPLVITNANEPEWKTTVATVILGLLFLSLLIGLIILVVFGFYAASSSHKITFMEFWNAVLA